MLENVSLTTPVAITPPTEVLPKSGTRTFEDQSLAEVFYDALTKMGRTPAIAWGGRICRVVW